MGGVKTLNGCLLAHRVGGNGIKFVYLPEKSYLNNGKTIGIR